MSVPKRLLMGNEAVALGAIRAGVNLASGYPGTPSSEIIETLAAEKPEGVYIEWSVNEKTALEVAAGSAVSGARVLVTMKQVGLNVASDPLMSLNYVGVKGAMVVAVADDPGPISSQTEQDTRHFGIFSKLAVFDPSSPEEAYAMIADAFACSEKLGRPVIFRLTTRVCHAYASVELLEPLQKAVPEGFSKDKGRWVIFPKLAYENHIKIEKALERLSDENSDYSGNMLSGGGTKGIACGGVSWSYVKEALEGAGVGCKLLKIGAYPFPERLGREFLEGIDEVLAVEELDPVIERELISLCGKYDIKVSVKRKLSGDMPVAGEYSPATVDNAVKAFLGIKTKKNAALTQSPVLPVRPPVLCAGCPHRASFLAVKEAAKGRKAVFSGDIGCYTLGNALPLDMVDTCLCMGAGITMAQGINRVEPDTLNFAFIGDSTFFHTGIPGIINAVWNRSDIIIAVLDNSTTAMTGGQPHPGMGRTALGKPAKKISIFDVVTALGADSAVKVGAFDYKAAVNAVKTAMEMKGVRVIIFEGECVSLSRGSPFSVIEDKCSGCSLCHSKLGCPAITIRNGKAEIDPDQCSGCGLCSEICAFGAITGRDAP